MAISTRKFDDRTLKYTGKPKWCTSRFLGDLWLISPAKMMDSIEFNQQQLGITIYCNALVQKCQMKANYHWDINVH
jgi:hypothetical protein